MEEHRDRKTENQMDRDRDIQIPTETKEEAGWTNRKQERETNTERKSKEEI